MANVTINCLHEKTLFVSEQNGFTIASYKTDDGSSIPQEARGKYQPQGGKIAFTAVGTRIPTTPSAEITLTGTWADGKYGKQLNVTACSVARPQTPEGIAAYLSSDLINGIGEKTAKAIVAKFGVDTFNIIDNEPQRLLEIPGITESKLETIMECYHQNTGLRDIMTSLADYGVTPSKAKKILAMYGAQAAEIVKENPYALCSIHGFGFKVVDKMANTKGIAPDNPQRIREAAMYALGQSQQSGHLFLVTNELCAEALKLLGKILRKKVSDVPTEAEESLVKKAVLDLVLEGRLQEFDGRIYMPKNYHAERITAELACAKIKPTPITGDVKQAIEDAEKKFSINLADKQREAVAMAVTNNFSIITGGPGTGKTTVIKTLVEVYKNMTGGTVAFAAPTGRASRRLSESVGDKAATLHNTLGMTQTNHEAKKLIEADKLIVDESSMIDMQLAYQLFSSLSPKTGLILVGDFNQLPSVGAGNVFMEMLLCGAIPVTKLDAVYRQAQTSRINLNAHAILNNNTALLYGEDFTFIEASTPEATVEQVKQTFFEYAQERGLGVDKVQILCPMRAKGACCVNELNKAIQTKLNPKSDKKPDVRIGFNTFRLHDKVMQTKNDNENDVSNGDVGRIREIIKESADNIRVAIDFGDGRRVVYDYEGMESIDLAYATTIHKSQGSEYPVVIIPILQGDYIMLQRNLIYTAVTRAKSKVFFIGQKKPLFWGIHKSEITKRNTVLGALIKEMGTSD